ncbi:DUF5342 family protein [Alteribacillus sp. HJP-4]|uniref:DUF5342 family protein n=1 Tax=Alteribacillus sp. HJP-4 TaxID=2775394 RepID=UPI0035CCDCB8
MISHFQWAERINNLVRKEWSFSFYFKGTYFTGIYNMDGTIDWNGSVPAEHEKLEAGLHDLFLYHVYEDHQPE